MEIERSGYIFDLANKYCLPISADQLWPTTDKAFLGFKDEYNNWSPKRNVALENHLVRRPNLFRVFLPYTQRVFSLAANIIWYLDEIVVRDPVSVVLNNPALDLQEAKIQLKQVLQVLSLFKSAIENGYILLRGSKVINTATKEPSDLAKELSNDPELITAMINSANYGYVEKKGENGERILIYKASLDAGGIVQFKIEGISGGKTVTIPIGVNEEYPEITLGELKKIIKDSPEEHLRHIFPREVERTLKATETAQLLNSAVLFDRTLDGIILSKTESQLNTDQQIATAGLLDLTLPFVSGIPPERLMEVRAKMPNAFMDFRANMYEIVKESMNDCSDPASIKEAVNSRVIPNLRKIDGEINSTLKRTRILGFGIPIVSGVAVLVGGVLSVPALPLIGLAAGGVLGGVKAASESAGVREKIKSHPFYFLWEAKK